MSSYEQLPAEFSCFGPLDFGAFRREKGRLMMIPFLKMRENDGDSQTVPLTKLREGEISNREEIG